MSKGNESASPIYDFIAPNTLSAHSLGLTKREYLAGLAMQGFAAYAGPLPEPGELFKCAAAYADALLAELEK